MSKQLFSHNGSSLQLDAPTNDLNAYCWTAPGDVPVFFVFAEDNVHIITLDDGEQPLEQVCSRTQTVAFQPVSDEEVLRYAELHALKHGTA